MVDVANKNLNGWFQYPVAPTYRGSDPTNTGSGGGGGTLQFPQGTITGQDNSAIPGNLTTNKNVPVIDPTYGFNITRITDVATEPVVGHARVDYSRRQAANADNTKVLISAENGFWHVYDTRANGWAYDKQLSGPAGDTEAQWHPTDPDKLWYTGQNGGMVYNELTVSTNASVVLKDFTTELQAISGFATAGRLWSKSEGMASADGRYWAFQVETDGFAFLGLMIWDRQLDTITTRTDAQLGNPGRPDHVSMSASGQYIVPSWFDGGNGFGVRAYERDFSAFVQLQHISEHSDLGLLPNGNDFYIAVSYQDRAELGYIGGDVYIKEIQTDTTTVLFNSYAGGSTAAFHFSAKCFDVPGYVVISAYAQNGAQQFYHNKIMVYDIVGDEYYHIAHTQDQGTGGFFAEPHATCSRDLSEIFYNSDRTSPDIEAYNIETGVTNG